LAGARNGRRAFTFGGGGRSALLAPLAAPARGGADPRSPRSCSTSGRTLRAPLQRGAVARSAARGFAGASLDAARPCSGVGEEDRRLARAAGRVLALALRGAARRRRAFLPGRG